LVFVYGTLKRGFYNHSLLERAEFIREDQTEAGFVMVSRGSYPAVYQDPTRPDRVHGELFTVDDRTLRILDQLESPYGYKRILAKMLIGGDLAWLYVVDSDVGHLFPEVEGGLWRG
jgi:gamma-glutamylaminecyclotransferase